MIVSCRVRSLVNAEIALAHFAGTDKALHSRPGDLFGQFSLDLHLGRSHPERASQYHGTRDRSVHPRGLSLPRNSVGLPDLPTGMMNVTAKAGDILVCQRY